MQNIPVLLMLFNRKDTTQKLFDRLREIKPKIIFIAANGPREGNKSDRDSCSETRAIFDHIDWDCEVHRNFRDTNIGMQPHWYLAIDWFFNFVDKGIILEDDCIPNESFFKFCDELLEKYANDDKIMHINGSNFQFGRKRGNSSYYFSAYQHVWGWATWKRAWKNFDVDLSTFPEFEKANSIDKYVSSKIEKKYWLKFFKEIYLKKRDGSDVKWFYSIWANNGICITPNANMITNIGFGSNAEHTIFKNKTLDQVSYNIEKIIHPEQKDLYRIDKAADNFVFKNVYKNSFFKKIFYFILIKIFKLFKK